MSSNVSILAQAHIWGSCTLSLLGQENRGSSQTRVSVITIAGINMANCTLAITAHLEVTHFTSTLFSGQTRHTTTPSEGGEVWASTQCPEEGASREDHPATRPLWFPKRRDSRAFGRMLTANWGEEKRWSWAGSLWASSPPALVTNSDQQIWIPVASGAGFCNSQAPAKAVGWF